MAYIISAINAVPSSHPQARARLTLYVLTYSSHYQVIQLAFYAADLSLLLFFFKQKTAYEIWSVTGVQTCALPISAASRSTVAPVAAWIMRPSTVFTSGEVSAKRLSLRLVRTRKLGSATPTRRATIAAPRRASSAEIGRASCREREEVSGAHETRKK